MDPDQTVPIKLSDLGPHSLHVIVLCRCDTQRIDLSAKAHHD